MKFSSSWSTLFVLALFFTTSQAATSSVKSPPLKAKAAAAAKPSAAPPVAPAPTAPAPALPSTTLKFDDYVNDLTGTLKLTDPEKKEIVGYYSTDGPKLQALLNNDSLSPLQQAQQVADLRDARNARISALLLGVDRKRDFSLLEAQYRVALTLLAADGGWVAAANPAPAPAK